MSAKWLPGERFLFNDGEVSGAGIAAWRALTPGPRDSVLDALENEGIALLREVAASCRRPVMLYSAGKDSSALLHLARKAFHPGKIPFPLLHVDTGWKFPEMIAFRDQTARDAGVEMIAYRNEAAIASGANPWALGTPACCGQLKTAALRAALTELDCDAAIGGARRDEERSRAKERMFSFRDRHGQWDPRQQRPEILSLFNLRLGPDEHLRAFPLSNWTELDVWHYVERERIPVAPLYFAQPRDVIADDGRLRLASGIPEGRRRGRTIERVTCRFRTLGCSPCTGAIRSTAATVREVIEELSSTRASERANRAIDHDRDGSMELKKREGYF
jgi:sulfate adenylyltransferase subunit 2